LSTYAFFAAPLSNQVGKRFADGARDALARDGLCERIAGSGSGGAPCAAAKIRL
jgi:hypothetical protein